MKSKNKFIIIIFILGFTLIIASTFLVTKSKYIYNALYEKYLEAKNFYFESDEVSLNGETFTINNWNEDQAYIVPITIKNYKNNLAYTKDNIDYEVAVECSSNVTCNTDLTSNKGTLTGNSKASSTFNLSISKSGTSDIDTLTATLKITSTKPYKKTMQATFNIKLSEYAFEIEDSSNKIYLMLQLLNAKDAAHTYQISFDPKVVNIDMTDSLVINATNKKYTTIDGHSYLSGLDITLNATSSDEIVFYKVDSAKDYTYPIKNSISIITVK